MAGRCRYQGCVHERSCGVRQARYVRSITQAGRFGSERHRGVWHTGLWCSFLTNVVGSGGILARKVLGRDMPWDIVPNLCARPGIRDTWEPAGSHHGVVYIAALGRGGRLSHQVGEGGWRKGDGVGRRPHQGAGWRTCGRSNNPRGEGHEDSEPDAWVSHEACNRLQEA